MLVREMLMKRRVGSVGLCTECEVHMGDLYINLVMAIQLKMDYYSNGLGESSLQHE